MPEPTTRRTEGYTHRIDRFLHLMHDSGASDLHFAVGNPPMLRLHGRMEPIRYRTLSPRDFDGYIAQITPPELWKVFQETGDMDFAYEVEGLARFRVNIFRQHRGSGAVFRQIPTQILTIEQLGLPEVVYRFARFERGLVLVTGPTGSGKSTTMAAITDEINERRKAHIITIEDPIEFVHPGKTSIITQREVGTNATSFASALHAAMREDPDVVLVGEMRDLETITAALQAAETGLLVFGTLHTNSAGKAVDRIINAFPADEQPNIRSVLADTLRGVLAQQLVRRKGGGRFAALEVLFGSPALGTLIREGKTHHLTNYIQMGKAQGMRAMDDALMEAVHSGMVEMLDAYDKSIDKKDFRARLRKEFGFAVPGGDDEAEAMMAMGETA
ncbi:MAG: type IV pilus twitching motility protein PilT [Deltaproteobacteria bacterium]|nr:type IV pilus twitching motility protein PilT [Deltaproteobacteria bacterium]MCB9785763.1 type IV pilus twitching motility protein PilT [Deltaproteobacteria bacterium]